MKTLTKAALAKAALASALVPASPLAAQEGGGGLFSVDPGLSLWTIVTFLVVLFVLGKFAWGPMLGALAAREEGIRDSIEEARQMRQEAQELMEEHRRQLAEARRESQEIVSKGKEAAERIRREIEEKARGESERILSQARLEIQRERDKALREIRKEAVELALAAAARLLDEKLSEERDRALVRAYLEEIQPAQAEA